MTSSKLKTVLLFSWLASLILPILEVVFQQESLSVSVLLVKRLQRLGVLICYFAIVTSGLVTFITVRCTSSKIANLHNNESDNRTLEEMRQRNKQVAKTIALVVVSFSICWVPIIYIGGRFTDHYSILHFWGVLPGFANSAVNPCIYFYRQKRYRQAFKAVANKVLNHSLTCFKTDGYNQFWGVHTLVLAKRVIKACVLIYCIKELLHVLPSLKNLALFFQVRRFSSA